jgi:hypothetical protein
MSAFTLRGYLSKKKDSGAYQVSNQAASLHRIHTDHNASMSQFDQIPPLVHLQLKYLKCSLPHHNLS